MSKSNCSQCPLETIISDTKPNLFCGDPTIRCINYRGLLSKKMDFWNRASDIASLSRSGKLDLNLLKSNDVIQIISTAPGEGYATGQERALWLDVVNVMDDGRMSCTVKHDSYLDLAEKEPLHDSAGWGLPIGETIVIDGSYNPEERNQDLRIAVGQIEVGKRIWHSWREKGRWGLLVQEIFLYDSNSNSVAELFGTDPSTFRPPNQ